MTSETNNAETHGLRPPEVWMAGGIFTALTILFTYPLSINPGRVVLGDHPDTHLFIWTLGWIAHATPWLSRRT